jgi:heme/copper-type cytochrome/quinol oxidase subunit 2
MTAKVVALEPAAFKTWLATKKAEIKAADEAAAKRRAEESEQLEQGNSPVTEELPKAEGK